MPQASSELLAEWGEMDGRAEHYLTGQGYKLLKGWFWRKPTPDHVITEKENRAIQFLVEEWDFGGIADDNYQGEVIAP